MRRAAAQYGVNLDDVTPTGAGGRISVADVQAAAGVSPAPRPTTRPVATTSSGPLPAFTASGVDPQALAGLPGPAKAAAAAAPTQAQAFSIAQACAGKNTGEALRILAADPSVENQPLVDYMIANDVRLDEGETITFESPSGGVPMSNNELHGGSW